MSDGREDIRKPQQYRLQKYDARQKHQGRKRADAHKLREQGRENVGCREGGNGGDDDGEDRESDDDGVDVFAALALRPPSELRDENVHGDQGAGPHEDDVWYAERGVVDIERG